MCGGMPVKPGRAVSRQNAPHGHVHRDLLPLEAWKARSDNLHFAIVVRWYVEVQISEAHVFPHSAASFSTNGRNRLLNPTRPHANTARPHARYSVVTSGIEWGVASLARGGCKREGPHQSAAHYCLEELRGQSQLAASRSCQRGVGGSRSTLRSQEGTRAPSHGLQQLVPRKGFANGGRNVLPTVLVLDDLIWWCWWWRWPLALCQCLPSRHAVPAVTLESCPGLDGFADAIVVARARTLQSLDYICACHGVPLRHHVQSACP